MSKSRNDSKSNNKVIVGAIGAILSVIGILASVALAVNKLTSWMFLSGFIVVIGIILVASAFSD